MRDGVCSARHVRGLAVHATVVEVAFDARRYEPAALDVVHGAR